MHFIQKSRLWVVKQQSLRWPVVMRRPSVRHPLSKQRSATATARLQASFLYKRQASLQEQPHDRLLSLAVCLGASSHVEIQQQPPHSIDLCAHRCCLDIITSTMLQTPTLCLEPVKQSETRAVSGLVSGRNGELVVAVLCLTPCRPPRWSPVLGWGLGVRSHTQTTPSPMCAFPLSWACEQVPVRQTVTR